MSEDSQEHPKPSKLKLSRDIKAKADNDVEKNYPQTGADNEPPTDSTKDALKPTPPPAMKLSRRAPEEVSADSTGPTEPIDKTSSDPVDGRSAAPQDSDLAQKPSTSPQSEEAPVEPAFDTSKPFGNGVKEGEIKDATNSDAPPPSEPAIDSQAQPEAQPEAQPVAEASAHALPKAIGAAEGGLPFEEDAPKKHSLLPSILVILFLFLFLGVCGYGIWWILKPSPDQASLDDSAAPIAVSTDSEAPSGPIQKAKDAIAKVPVADVEALTTDDHPDSPNADKTEASPDTVSEASETAQATESDESSDIPETTARAATPNPSSASDAVEQSKEAVSKFLSDMHIGGVRQSANPMILINGDSYLVGDVVHEATGLKFIGLRNERPAFKDPHGIVYLRSF